MEIRLAFSAESVFLFY